MYDFAIDFVSGEGIGRHVWSKLPFFGQTNAMMGKFDSKKSKLKVIEKTWNVPPLSFVPFWNSFGSFPTVAQLQALHSHTNVHNDQWLLTWVRVNQRLIHTHIQTQRNEVNWKAAHGIRSLVTLKTEPYVKTKRSPKCISLDIRINGWMNCVGWAQPTSYETLLFRTNRTTNERTNEGTSESKTC